MSGTRLGFLGAELLLLIQDPFLRPRYYRYFFEIGRKDSLKIEK